MGFKNYLNYYVNESRRFVELCDSSPLFFNRDIDAYLDALEVIEVDDKFKSILTQKEKEVIAYYKYHNPYDAEPDNFDKLFMVAYNKWLTVLPKKKPKISSYQLGKTMKIIRAKNNISINSLSLIMNVDRNTVSQYEKGDRLPSLEYFYKFCIKFDLSLDELLKRK